MIIRVARYIGAGVVSEDTPCEGAVVRYGEWRQARRQVYEAYTWAGKKERGHTPMGLRTERDILKTPDNDAKRGAVADGDDVVWECRDRWWEVEVKTIEELIAVVGNDGKMYADGGEPYIEFED